jgi:hypothetical protein
MKLSFSEKVQMVNTFKHKWGQPQLTEKEMLIIENVMSFNKDNLRLSDEKFMEILESSAKYLEMKHDKSE